MACCVLMAALFGGLAIIKAMLTLTLRGHARAQEWRLTDRRSRVQCS